MILGTFIGHVLLLERILATVLVSKYENIKKPYFSIFCFIIMTSLSFFNSYEQTYSESVLDVTLGTLITLYITLCLGIVEIALIAYIGYYNNNKYKLGTIIYLKHSLTERYQLSENIRTSRQLKPTFIFHFINILVSSGITILFKYDHIKDISIINLLFVFVFLITAFCNLSIEITIIIFHPILNIQLKQLLIKYKNKLKLFNKIGISETKQSHPITTLDGRNLIFKERNDLSQKYFEMLKKSWE
ncbi:hypothetical protein ACQ4LE_009192 [Meloidogyne hapla]